MTQVTVRTYCNSLILFTSIFVISTYCMQFGLKTHGPPKHTAGTTNTVTMTLYWMDLRYQCNVDPIQLNTAYLCDTWNVTTTRECDGALNPIQYGLQISNDATDAIQIDQVIIKDIDNQTENIIIDYFCFNISNISQNIYTPLTNHCLCALYGGYDYIRIDSDHFVPFQLIIIDQQSIINQQSFVYNVSSAEPCIDIISSWNKSYSYDMNQSSECTLIKYPTHDPTLEPALQPTVIIIIVIIGVGVILLLITIIYCKYIKKNQHDHDTMSPMINTRDPICNALVVLIGIGEYKNDDNNINHSDIGNDNLKNIPVDKDLNNLRELFKLLNYKIIPYNDNKHRWTESEIMSLLKDNVGKELFDNNDILKYDGLIVCITCHGIENHIITSDLKAIEKPVIHRIISLNYPSVRVIPRIFIFDTCDGDAEKTMPNTEEKQMLLIDDDKGKYVKLIDISSTKPWDKDDKNPDYELVQIHASNIGFQAKYNKKIGSYLLAEFTNKMKENIMQNQHLSLGQIFDKIQNKLHDEGRQQPVATFNNNTRNLVLQCNKH